MRLVDMKIKELTSYMWHVINNVSHGTSEMDNFKSQLNPEMKDLICKLYDEYTKLIMKHDVGSSDDLIISNTVSIYNRNRRKNKVNNLLK